jgi:SAM-dependent methyltransferase
VSEPSSPAGSPPPSIRTAVLWDTLAAALDAERSRVGRPLDVVDVGGGTGRLATWIASAGHLVTVVDPSPDALAALDRRANEAGVTVRGLQGDTDSLLGLVGAGGADVVCCHGVLELVDDADLALGSVAEILRPGGLLSVVAAQRSGAVLSRALAGQFAEGVKALEDSGIAAPRRFTRRRLEQTLSRAGFSVSTVQGLRIFVDHVSAAMVELQPGARDTLRELEAAVAGDPEFVGAANQLHILARR